MKKIAILTALFVAFSCGSALAGATDYVASTITKTGFEVQLSNKVEMNYWPESVGLGYSVAAFHTSGTKTFGSSSGDSKIFWILGIDSPTLPNAPSGTASAGFGSWTAL